MSRPDTQPDPEPTIRLLGPAQFAPHVDAAIEIYGLAMRRPPEVVTQRRAILHRHLDRGRFRAVVAFAGADPVGFGYGYLGAPGQWWHDSVALGLGRDATTEWLTDPFEVAELHVHPDHQGRGTGRRLLTTLMDGVGTATVVLSTHDQASPARHLYHSVGFVDLLTNFRFPGGIEIFAVMGKRLRD